MDEPADKKRRASRKVDEPAAIECKLPAVKKMRAGRKAADKKRRASKKMDEAAAIECKLTAVKKMRAGRKAAEMS
eukprot:gene18296-24756_t